MLCVLLAFGSANASDYTLEIFGNANMDETIDEEDITYVEGIIKGTNAATNLSDANYDGKVDEKDITQIGQIISGEEKELTLIDSAYRIITVEEPIEKIVVMNNEAAEIIRAFGSKDKIVGISSGIANDKIFFSDFSNLPDVGTGHSSPDYERILDIKPDILIYYSLYAPSVGKGAQELEKELKTMDIKLICLDCFYPQTMMQDVKKLSYLLGKKDEANEFIDWYEGYLDMIESRTEGLPKDKKPRVYIDSGSFNWGTSSNGSPDDAICTIAGGTNIAKDIIGSTYSVFPTIDPEWVISQNPEVMVVCGVSGTLASSGYDEDDAAAMDKFKETIKNRSELADITAIKNDKIFLISPDITREPEYIVATAYLAKYLHPDLFNDLNPQEIHKEYLTRFQGLNYDLDKHGVFVYPPLVGS